MMALVQRTNSQPTMDEGGIKVCNVAAGEPQDFDLGELPICRFGGNHRTQSAHSAVHAADKTKQQSLVVRSFSFA
jgi:hypothetical protein